MSKLAIPLALAAVALVAACAYRATPAPAPVVVVPQQPPAVVQAPAAPAVVQAPAPVVIAPQPTALRAGFGRVESISASSAGTTSAVRRLGIKMNDGTVQYVDSDAPNLAIGDRVELTANGYLRHPI